jgi:3'(2'), 5'-bisphosphate nucleotidase
MDAAFAAGRAIMDVYARGFEVGEKSDRSPITEADLRAHAAIERVLGPSGLPMLSEEGRPVPLSERQAWPRYWLVDPLDGTKEFVKRNGEFTVNIALMERDGQPAGPLGASMPIAGVLYVPVTGTLYYAWKGGGAYRQQHAATLGSIGPYERTRMSDRIPLPQQRAAYTIVASRSHASPETEAFIARARQQQGVVALTSIGSAIKIALVAEGTADAYPRYAPTMEWDVAAGQAIANEAGRTVVDVTTGNPMRYNKQELVNNWFIVH